MICLHYTSILDLKDAGSNTNNQKIFSEMC